LRANGVEALEFWNYGATPIERDTNDVRFLRSHVLALPIHQDLSPRHLTYIAAQVAALRKQAA
jgi:hypothetical protein